MSTLMDPLFKLVSNEGNPIPHLEYSEVIIYLMFVMTNTWPDIAFEIEKMSRYTSNPSAVHWVALKLILKYLTKKNITNFGNSSLA